ncbi:MAG: ATP-binding protein [Deltaproteobacteria bacterium]|nr:ATP-binding protein [Deltaproteobacteria bacterium]
MELQRSIEKDLLAWKTSNPRKPLILKGARQTGKTFSLNVFGKGYFSRVHHLNFQKNKELRSIFDGSLDPERLIESIEFVLDCSIDQVADLLFLDEIQDCPAAITSLKYFHEDMSHMAICAAGSLLGVTQPEVPFPVGQVTFLTMRPLSFEEFLLAIGEKRTYSALRATRPPGPLAAVVHHHALSLLNEYFVTGGMPEVVASYALHRTDKHRALAQVRHIQNDLITASMGDFSKYSGKVDATVIASLFESIPAQLARENKKFKTSSVMPGGRFSRLQSSIDWLVAAGLAIRVKMTNSGELPFAAFTKENAFKLYLYDIGILGALAGLSPRVLMTASEPFATFKGAFCENFVAQEFLYSGVDSLYSWSSNKAEVEFLREVEGEVFPVEVKAGLSGKLKSLKVFQQKYRCKNRVRISARNLEINHQANMHSYPLYLAHRFPLK